jgi:hypothetical protein
MTKTDPFNGLPHFEPAGGWLVVAANPTARSLKNTVHLRVTEPDEPFDAQPRDSDRYYASGAKFPDGNGRSGYLHSVDAQAWPDDANIQESLQVLDVAHETDGMWLHCRRGVEHVVVEVREVDDPKKGRVVTFWRLDRSWNTDRSRMAVKVNGDEAAAGEDGAGGSPNDDDLFSLLGDPSA